MPPQIKPTSTRNAPEPKSSRAAACLWFIPAPDTPSCRKSAPLFFLHPASGDNNSFLPPFSYPRGSAGTRVRIGGWQPFPRGVESDRWRIDGFLLGEEL